MLPLELYPTGRQRYSHSRLVARHDSEIVLRANIEGFAPQAPFSCLGKAYWRSRKAYLTDKTIDHGIHAIIGGSDAGRTNIIRMSGCTPLTRTSCRKGPRHNIGDSARLYKNIPDTRIHHPLPYALDHLFCSKSLILYHPRFVDCLDDARNT